MIATQQLSKEYDGVPAVREVTLNVPQGQFCVLLGPSGCGKSTLLKMINALVAPTSGSVLVQGQDIAAIPPQLLRRQMGYVVQSVGLFPHYSVRRNIEVVPRLLKWPKARIDARVEEVFALTGLPAASLDKYPHMLSGGEAQRVGVARALAADPPILLMDEPFGSVDPLTRERLQQAFADIQRRLKKTVLFVTHDVAEALRLGDRILLMREGRIVRDGTPVQMVLQRGDHFSDAFFGTQTALLLMARYRVFDAWRPMPTTPAQPDCATGVEVSPSGEPSPPGCATGVGVSLSGAPVPPGCAIDMDAPLSDALSWMMTHGCPQLAVTHAGQVAGQLAFQDLLRFFAEAAHAAPS